MHLTTIVTFILVPLAIAAPTPKDNKIFPQASESGPKNRIGVDRVDVKPDVKLRVDPVRIDLHTRQPAMDHDALRPSPYSDADLKIDARDVSAIVELADRGRKIEAGPGSMYIPHWRKT